MQNADKAAPGAFLHALYPVVNERKQVSTSNEPFAVSLHHN
jgi:hypothetical protein